MKIFTAEQIYAADKFTIENQGISADTLMEQAAISIFNWLHARLQGAPVRIVLFCGIGNNGGGGLALARHLQEHGYNILVYVVNYSEKRAPEFLINLDRLKDRKVWPEFIDGTCCTPEILQNDIIVDAIFGIGLNRPPVDWVQQLMQHINALKAFVLSVDVPSGLFMNQKTEPGAVVQASYVLSFQSPKLPFFLPDTGSFLGQWEVLDIGLDSKFLADLPTKYTLLTKPLLLPIYRPRAQFSHKGTYGHAAIIGGSYGKIGAAQMAAKACLKIGSGLVSVHTPECGYTSMQAALPEVMVSTAGEKQLTSMELSFVPDAIGIGVGMGEDETTLKAFEKFLNETKVPLVVDADAINLCAAQPKLCNALPKDTILTPHPKELERLIGTWDDDWQKLEKAHSFSVKHNCILIIKGAHSIIINGEEGYINITGNPGMATAGTGDVLTGVVTGLLAQGYTPMNAAVLGTYLHGLAGDITASQQGVEATIATEVIQNIGNAYGTFLKMEEPTNEEQQN